MFVRSPRRFAILSSLAFVFIFALLQQSPWAHEKVYERMPLFDLGRRPTDQELLHEGQGASQAHLDDAWQHAVPLPGAKPTITLPPPMVVSHEPVKEPVKEPAATPTKTKTYPPWVTAPSRVGSFIPPFSRPSNMKKYLEKMLKWPRPSWDGHWPPFADYIDKAYDPNRWEEFDM